MSYLALIAVPKVQYIFYLIGTPDIYIIKHFKTLHTWLLAVSAINRPLGWVGGKHARGFLKWHEYIAALHCVHERGSDHWNSWRRYVRIL